MSEIVESPPTITVKPDEKPSPDRPYDALVRIVMQYPEVAKDVICHHYPASITDTMAFSQMVLQPGSYVDKDYRRLETDVLFSVPCKDEEVLLYFLIEHQHQPDKNMAWRLLNYIMRIMNDHKKRHDGDKLPLVMPVVLYDGKQPWSSPTDFRDLIDAPRAWVEQVWDKPYKVVQVCDIKEDEIKQYHWSGVLSWIMAHAQARDVLEQLAQSVAQSALERLDMAGSKARQYVIELFSHILYTNSQMTEESLRAYMHAHFSPELEGGVMTLAQRLEDRGMQKGKLEGKLEGEHSHAVATAKRLLKKGFSYSEIAEIANLPEYEVELLDTDDE